MPESTNGSNGAGVPCSPTLPPAPVDGKYRLLVVEDDPSIARLLLVTLDKMGFEMHHAQDGPGALEAFRASNPHLVILDLWLPGMDGRQVCTELRKTSTVPVIVMTASDSESVEMQSFKMGADDFVTKPFNPQLLIARIVANLRRAYRYDAAPASDDTSTEANSSGPRDMAALAGIKPVRDEDEPAVPMGWAKCDACNYMGPRSRFEAENVMGQRSLLCPNCKESNFIVFSLG